MATGGPGKGKEISPILARPWMILFLPINAALAGFAVILPILILFYYQADVLTVALAQSVYSLLLIPGSVLWGRVCDRMPNRRPLLLFNYIAVGAIFLGMFMLRTLDGLLLFYGLFGFVAPSGAAASTLLVMERFDPHERPAAFASFQEVSVIGATVGVLAGFFWLLEDSSALNRFLLITFVFAAVSAVLLLLLVPEKKMQLTRNHIADHHWALTARLRSVYPFFIRLPSPAAWKGTYRWLREEATHEVPLILAASFLFNFSANMFNTSYTPYLAYLGIGVTGIFVVNLANNAAQVVTLPFSAKASSGDSADRSVIMASWGRAGGYGVGAIMALLPIAWIANRGDLLGANIVLYAVLGGAVAFYGTASSLLLYRSLEGRGRGTYLGLNSALGGVAAVLGAGLSGIVTVAFGYSATFGFAMFAMAAAIPVWLWAGRALRNHHPSSDATP